MTLHMCSVSVCIWRACGGVECAVHQCAQIHQPLVFQTRFQTCFRTWVVFVSSPCGRLWCVGCPVVCFFLSAVCWLCVRAVVLWIVLVYVCGGSKTESEDL